MKSINAKLEIMAELIVYSLLFWILTSGSTSNRGTFLGFVFFALSMFVTMTIWQKISERIPHSKAKVILVMLLFIALSVAYPLLWGYFDIKMVPFMEI